MQKISPQHEKTVIRLIGWIVIPLSLWIPLLRFGIHDYNITGLLNLPGYRMLFHTLALVALLWIDFLFLHHIGRSHEIEKLLILLNILILLALFIPYEEGQSLMNSLHITSAYVAFVSFDCFFVWIFRYDRKILSAFFSVNVLSLFLSLSAGKVTGLSEVLFGSAVSILLTL